MHLARKKEAQILPLLFTLSVLNSLSAAIQLLILIEFEFLNKVNKYIMNLKLPLIIQSFLAVSSCHVIKKLNMDVIKAFFGSTTYKYLHFNKYFYLVPWCNLRNCLLMDDIYLVSRHDLLHILTFWTQFPNFCLPLKVQKVLWYRKLML